MIKGLWSKLANTQAEQELVSQGRPKPKGDRGLRCLIDALIALAAALPLVLFIGRDHGDAKWAVDKEIMWAVVFAIGIASYAIRYYTEQAWWRDWVRRAKMIAEDRAREEQRDRERTNRLSKLLGSDRGGRA